MDVDALIARPSTAEKIRLVSGEEPFWTGIVGLLRHDRYHQRPFVAARHPALGLPGLAFVDGPRGVVLEGGATTFPVAMARGATWNPALEEQIGEAIGREVRALGANLFGGVCVNLLRHPGWGRAQETYGEDPVHVGEMGAALVRGVARHAMACVKHLALNSIENARFRVDVKVAPRPLHELYLPAFRACVEAGATAVMSAYNRVNGDWCGESRALLTDILKRRWGFSGFVLTDFLFGLRDARRAIDAGLDLEMPFAMVLADGLPRLLAEGHVAEARLDDAVRRLIGPQLALSKAAYPRDVVGCTAHSPARPRCSRWSCSSTTARPCRCPPTPGSRWSAAWRACPTWATAARPTAARPAWSPRCRGCRRRSPTSPTSPIPGAPGGRRSTAPTR